MSTGNAVKSIEAIHFAATDFTGAYQLVNELGFGEACFMIRIVNNSSANILISFDGVTDHDYLASGKSLQLPTQDNALPSGLVAKFRRGTSLYFKAFPFKIGFTGIIYLIGYY